MEPFDHLNKIITNFKKSVNRGYTLKTLQLNSRGSRTFE